MIRSAISSLRAIMFKQLMTRMIVMRPNICLLRKNDGLMGRASLPSVHDIEHRDKYRILSFLMEPAVTPVENV